MVRVTPLQWCSRLELAKEKGPVLVVGRNLGTKGDLFAIGQDLMLCDYNGTWYSLTEGGPVDPTEFKPVAFAVPRYPDDLPEFLDLCEECEKAYEENHKKEGD